MKLYVFVLRRLLLAIPVLLGVSLITFWISWVANEGQLWRAFITDKMSQQQVQQVIHSGGYDQPWYAQFFRYLWNLLHGDFGFSRSQNNLPVTEVFHQFFPPTLELTLVAMIFAVVIGVFLGVVSATRKDRPVDHFTRFMALSGVSLPIFWLGLMLKFVFATTFAKDAIVGLGTGGEAVFLAAMFALIVGILLFLADLFGAFRALARRGVKHATRGAWLVGLGAALALGVLLPLVGQGEAATSAIFHALPQFPLGSQFSNELVSTPGQHTSLTNGPTRLLLLDTAMARDWVAFKDVLWHLILPGFTLGYASMAIITRMMRSSMLETLSQDYVRTARAKGLSEGQVLRRHARRNALLPTTTVVGLAFGSLLGGAVLTETIFQWPGLGRWSTTAIFNADTNSVMDFTLMVTVFYLLANLVVDVVYAFLDPRVRLG